MIASIINRGKLRKHSLTSMDSCSDAEGLHLCGFSIADYTVGVLSILSLSFVFFCAGVLADYSPLTQLVVSLSIAVFTLICITRRFEDFAIMRIFIKCREVAVRRFGHEFRAEDAAHVALHVQHTGGSSTGDPVPDGRKG